MYSLTIQYPVMTLKTSAVARCITSKYAERTEKANSKYACRMPAACGDQWLLCDVIET
jgi:hypothetical protein